MRIGEKMVEREMEVCICGCTAEERRVTLREQFQETLPRLAPYFAVCQTMHTHLTQT